MEVPNRKHTTTPSPISKNAATNVPRPPRLLIHLPTPSPITFKITSTLSNTTEAASANGLLSPNAAWPGPSTKTETPTKYSIIVGTYIMLLVQQHQPERKPWKSPNTSLAQR